MKKYQFVKKYERFNLWLNTKNGCHECFWKEIDPNKIQFSKRKASDDNG